VRRTAVGMEGFVVGFCVRSSFLRETPTHVTQTSSCSATSDVPTLVAQRAISFLQRLTRHGDYMSGVPVVPLPPLLTRNTGYTVPMTVRALVLIL
jgi:hypothetical protein